MLSMSPPVTRVSSASSVLGELLRMWLMFVAQASSRLAVAQRYILRSRAPLGNASNLFGAVHRAAEELKET